MSIRLTLSFLFLSVLAFGQMPTKKIMDSSVYDEWKSIRERSISNDGQWVVYSLHREGGDGSIHIHEVDSGKEYSFERGKKGFISADNQFVIFTISPPVDSVKAMRRQKVKKDKLPTDTLGIYNLKNKKLLKIPDLKSVKMPREWSGWLAYKMDKPRVAEKDSTQKELKKLENDLIIRSLTKDFQLKVPDVKHFTFAKEGHHLLLSSEGADSTFDAGVYRFDADREALQPIFRSKGKYKHLAIDESGQQMAFLANLDTTNAQIRPFELYYCHEQNLESDSAHMIFGFDHNLLPETWIPSAFYKPAFSKDGQRLFFGITPPPILKDTTLLDEEIVQVEVWNYQDARLYPEQKIKLKDEKERSFLSVWHISENRFVQLANLDIPEIRLGRHKTSRYAVGYHEQSYLSAVSWDGFPADRDIYRVDVQTGEKHLVKTKVKANPRLSPAGKYLFWYDNRDTAWYTYDLVSTTEYKITNNQTVPFYDELNDRPMLPYSYGIAGWEKEDRSILVYDRYDIWQIDPHNKVAPRNLTQGRAEQMRHRYVRLDREAIDIAPQENLFLTLFNEKTKVSGYAHFDLAKRSKQVLSLDPYVYNTRPVKAKNANKLLYTKENFQVFPDLLVADENLKNVKRISYANPQQRDYDWGSIELYEWTSLDGEKLTGLLVKPENFDPNRKYPMIVNFYERSSDGLHRHRAPYPHRSTINYTMYANQGYLIFNPDVPYKVGYPGESAYNSVMPGVTALIQEGFVDEARIGLQGHSWGGYQVAHLVTRSNLFRCAESGAPVVNMFSAYGGIRWGSGLSRMFQYENTQSRIGGTIWDAPLRYLENSPLFFIDKIETPVLILHNDKDGAVPWYQGIEFFVAMRRLGKPAWLLNYNDEPHWPVKRQNRLDFNMRMLQFFDYYLKNQPLPQWMDRGVPAMEKGIKQGLELMKE